VVEKHKNGKKCMRFKKLLLDTKLMTEMSIFFNSALYIGRYLFIEILFLIATRS